ncbi:RNA polymerase sigma factor, partial [Paenibacillus chungangensis]
IVMILESQGVFVNFDDIFMTLIELPGFGLNCISHDNELMGGTMNENWWLLLEADFGELGHDLQRYLYNSFYAFAYREIYFLLKDHALAEDIIQEAFLKVTKNYHQLNNKNSLKQWTKQVIRNQVFDTMKKRRHETSLENVYMFEQQIANSEVAATVEHTIEVSERNQVLYKTIMELKPEYSTLLIKFYLEEISYNEIATELGINKQVVATRLSRARKALLVQFSKKWGDEFESGE